MKLEVDIEKQLKSFNLAVAFEVEDSCLGIMGQSGSGKSMTLKSIAGIVTPDAGKIVLNDRVLFDRAPGRRPAVNLIPQKRKVGYLFQNYALFPNMSVEDNIKTGLRAAGLSKAAIDERCQEMLEVFQIETIRDSYPGRISGGQKQRCALARIMAYSPDVILLDEPFSALDVKLKDELQNEVKQMLERYRHPAILVSHDPKEIFRLCQYTYKIQEGKFLNEKENEK